MTAPTQSPPREPADELLRWLAQDNANMQRGIPSGQPRFERVVVDALGELLRAYHSQQSAAMRASAPRVPYPGERPAPASPPPAEPTCSICGRGFVRDQPHTNCGDTVPAPTGVPILDSIADAIGGRVEWTAALPDGSGAAVMSLPLPADHWLTRDHHNVPPMRLRMAPGANRQAWAELIREAGRYAIRASTMNGKEQDFDPDAMLQNLCVGMLGYWTEDGTSNSCGDPYDNPDPIPPRLDAAPAAAPAAPVIGSPPMPNTGTHFAPAAPARRKECRTTDACCWPHCTCPPVDKTPNLQGSPVDKSAKSQGQVAAPAPDADGLVRRLRERLLMQHGGKDDWSCGWNLTLADSGMHRDAADLIAAQARDLAAARADAERWQALCNLWAASTVLTLAQDEDGGWSIEQTEAVDSEVFATLTGDDPDAAIDAARVATKAAP